MIDICNHVRMRGALSSGKQVSVRFSASNIMCAIVMGKRKRGRLDSAPSLELLENYAR